MVAVRECMTCTFLILSSPQIASARQRRAEMESAWCNARLVKSQNKSSRPTKRHWMSDLSDICTPEASALTEIL